MIRRRLVHILVLAAALALAACQATPSPAPPSPPPEVFVEPGDGAYPVLKQIAESQQSIRAAFYLLSDEDVIAALAEARERGVDVRVILEESPLGGGDTNRLAREALVAQRVAVMWGNPTFRYTHIKAMVVDDKTAVVMTLNPTRSAFTSNREYGLILRDPDMVAEIASVFDADWSRETASVRNEALAWSPINSRRKLSALIRGANTSLDVECPYLLDEDVESLLIDAARRGVRVRLVTAPSSGADVNAQALSRLDGAGVAVRYLPSPYVHAKVVIADETTAFVGSVNFSATSLDFNRELSVIVEHPDAVGTLLATFEKDWEEAQP